MNFSIMAYIKVLFYLKNKNKKKTYGVTHKYTIILKLMLFTSYSKVLTKKKKIITTW